MRAPPPFSTIHVSTARTWRGGENQILLLAQGLLARGQGALIVAPAGSPLYERAGEAGVPRRAVTLLSDWDPVGAWRLARLLREERPHFLHLHDSHAVLPGLLAARSRPASALGVIAHRRTVFRVRGRWKYEGRTDKVIAISAAVRQQLLEAGVAPARIAVVHSGLEFAEALPRAGAEAARLRAELNLPPGALLVAHAAALTAEKRQADLLEALALCRAPDGPGGRLKGRGPPGVHLAIAGSGNLEGVLRARARELGVAEQVSFLGFRRDLRALWAAADWACFASDAEGLCTALIEAQGAGLPAVVTRAGGMPEVVEGEATGLLVPVGDVNALAQAWLRLAREPARREAWGQAARARARRLFSAAAMVAGTLAVYRAVWKAKDDGPPA